MVLREELGFKVGAVERTAADEVDSLQKDAVKISNLHWTCRKLAVIVGVTDRYPEFQIVCAGKLYRGHAVGFEPFQSGGVPRLLTEIVPEVSDGSQHHIG